MGEDTAPAGLYDSTHEATTVAPSGFEDFFDEHRDRLFGILCLMTGNRHDAEDISQEAFLTLFERWDHIGSIEDPAAYVYRIAVNAFRKRQRRAEILRRITLGRRSEPSASGSDEPVLLNEALRSLTPRQRAALVLTELLGYDAGEAGEILGVHPSTIGALKYQGRSALKREFTDD